jgi:hypothetical protein
MTDYENGILLAKAYLAFAPRSLVREFEQARTFPKLRNIEKTLPQAAEDWPALVMETIVPALRAPFDIGVDMQQALLTGLRKGKFIALGYRLPRNPSDPAVQIPADLFDERFADWDNSAIKGAGLEFANVRVMRAPKSNPAIGHDLNPPVPSSKPDKLVEILENRRKVGRPLFAPRIEEAYNALNAMEGFKPDATKRAIAERIRQWIKRQYPGKATPSVETIRRYIVKRQSSKS